MGNDVNPNDDLREFVEAVGLATTAVPGMEIDSSDPIGMMHQVVAAMAMSKLSEELAWGLIANAYGGDWDSAPPEWKQAAERWRDAYYNRLPYEARSEEPEEPLV